MAGDIDGGTKRRKREQLCQYLLFVLMCPTCPQFAHFRVVPAAALSAEDGSGDASVFALKCAVFRLPLPLSSAMVTSVVDYHT